MGCKIMQITIDWLSFTVKFPVLEEDTEKIAFQNILVSLDEISPVILDVMDIENGWKFGSGRKPYKVSWQRNDFGMSIYLHPRLGHALIEISGKGCRSIEQHAKAADFLAAVAPRLTRLDLACDMLTETRPVDFVAARDMKRFKSHSEVVSESGETCYVGSKQSNRYARCYRYNEGHERSHLLRVEYVVKAEDARMTATAILSEGLNAVASALGAQYGWRHEDWNVADPTEFELRAHREERRDGKTLFWLGGTVAPLLIRLHREETFDVLAWFRENVMSKLTETD